MRVLVVRCHIYQKQVHFMEVTPMIGMQVVNQWWWTCGWEHGAGNLQAIHELLVVLGLKQPWTGWTRSNSLVGDSVAFDFVSWRWVSSALAKPRLCVTCFWGGNWSCRTNFETAPLWSYNRSIAQYELLVYGQSSLANWSTSILCSLQTVVNQLMVILTYLNCYCSYWCSLSTVNCSFFPRYHQLFRSLFMLIHACC